MEVRRLKFAKYYSCRLESRQYRSLRTSNMEVDFEKLTQPLSEQDWAELASILNADSWPDETLDLEGLDGLLAAGACGPRRTNPIDVLPLAFGTAEFPEFASPDKLLRFLELAVRRWNEYARSLLVLPDEMSEETFTDPYLFEIDTDDLATAMAWAPPKRAGLDHWRPGDWMGRAWAVGFLRVVSTDDAWANMLARDENHGRLVAPLLFLELGFNPDNPRMPFEPTEWMGEAIANLYRLVALFRHIDETAEAGEPLVRASPKVGRNDPCPCGSGLKFKKCCGAESAMH